MNTRKHTGHVTTSLIGVGDAVGVERRHWFVAIVKHNTEKASAQKLAKQGYECYVACQQEYRIWKNGRKVKVDRIVIPSIIFIYCTESERRPLLNFPYIFRFLTDKAELPNQFGKSIAIIPEKQIETLKFMLGNSDTTISFVNRIYKVGEKIKVIRGKLLGLEGEVLTSNDGQTDIFVSLGILGCAKVSINPIDLEPIK